MIGHRALGAPSQQREARLGLRVAGPVLAVFSEPTMERTRSLAELVESVEGEIDFDAADEMMMRELPDFDGDMPPMEATDEALGVPLSAPRLFKLCCGGHRVGHALDLEQLKAAHTDEWVEKKPNGATPLHALCANPNLTVEALRAAADCAPAEAWGMCTEHGANPLHRLFGNSNLTAEMLELVAVKVPRDAWHQVNLGGGTPAHRLCANSAAISAQMLKIAGRYAPPQTWKTKNLPGPKGKGGGLTPLDILFSRRMADARTPDLVREAAALMDGGAGGGAGATTESGGGVVRRLPRSLSGGSVGGGASPRRVSSSSSNSTGPTADWKLEAAKHFFALGTVGGVGLSTALAPPVITRQPGDVACVRLRGWVDGNTKGDCMNGCNKGTVFMEAKSTVAKVLDTFKVSRRSVKDSSGALRASCCGFWIYSCALQRPLRSDPRVKICCCCIDCCCCCHGAFWLSPSYRDVVQISFIGEADTRPERPSF